MRKITNQEIKALKIIIKHQTERIIRLQSENEDLRKSLYEARANEGRGVLEQAVDAISKGIAEACKKIKMFPTIYDENDSEDPEPFSNSEVDNEKKHC